MHKCVYTHDLKLLVQCASTSLDTKISAWVPNIILSASLARVESCYSCRSTHGSCSATICILYHWLKESLFINGSCPILVLNMVLGRLGVGVGASRLIWARFENWKYQYNLPATKSGEALIRVRTKFSSTAVPGYGRTIHIDSTAVP